MLIYRARPDLMARFLHDPSYRDAVLSWCRGHTLVEWVESTIWAVAEPVWTHDEIARLRGRDDAAD